jgi:hypothetical protein
MMDIDDRIIPFICVSIPSILCVQLTKNVTNEIILLYIWFIFAENIIKNRGYNIDNG